MKNDWNKYRDYFPTRYFEQGIFDKELEEYVKKNKVENILDIGGGAFGTEILKQFNKQVYLLDPNIKSCPEWMVDNLDYDHNLKFDLIVARGSINYLTPEQMSKILLWLKPKGIFLANTFLNPPSKDWTERPVTNKEGNIGLERVRLYKNKIEHRLVFDKYSIDHEFYYYSLNDYSNILKTIGYKKHGSNSVTIWVVN